MLEEKLGVLSGVFRYAFVKGRVKFEAGKFLAEDFSVVSVWKTIILWGFNSVDQKVGALVVEFILLEGNR